MSNHVTATFAQRITEDAIQYSRHGIKQSRFFTCLKKRIISASELRYVFLQYFLWRNAFHTWFGVVISKAGSSLDPHVADAVRELAEHIVVEMRDDHTGMYASFLREVFGISEQEMKGAKESVATRSYKRWFMRRFGIGTENFEDALAALAGRELFASLRNRFVLDHADFSGHEDGWWTAHEELEAEHFDDVIRPMIEKYGNNDSVGERFMNLFEQEIDRHVEYWDALYEEAKAFA